MAMIVPAHYVQIDATAIARRLVPIDRLTTRGRFKAKRAANRALTQIRRFGFRVEKSGRRILLRRAIKIFKLA